MERTLSKKIGCQKGHANGSRRIEFHGKAEGLQGESLVVQVVYKGRYVPSLLRLFRLEVSGLPVVETEGWVRCI